MRIISQNKTSDVNYKEASLLASTITFGGDYVKTEIIAVSNGTNFLLGTYNTKEKALEALKDIRDSYNRGNKIHYMLLDTDEGEEKCE